ncbi:GDSL-type esterase/lipase family protein [Streptomyces ficellus]|uniref:GDSL-type esterase/lipase family protein n=1 Tax=Streptomyces ficellus TaxID=1977088 RepID=A0ABT7Z3M7_9ACTN|nr:GDSL-type esterase/lipase family protein [Streptomyces ficellus]MDN3294097.1 GDSL-type esterase/lipase family protein [Streptomyces ficellus]
MEHRLGILRQVRHPAWYYLTAVDVSAEPPAGGAPSALMVFGDSLFDGVGTRPGTDGRFSDKLVERLVASHSPRGMVNASLAGNSLLHDSPCYGPKGTSRFEKELRSRTGVSTVFIHLGGNDIATAAVGDMCMANHRPVTAQELIAGHRRLIRLAHEYGVKAIGVTVLPLMGAVFPFTDDRGERVRQKLNHWIRTSGEYDAVVDADRTLADPGTPTRSRPGYVPEDGLHPNDAGYLAMSSQIDLNIL